MELERAWVHERLDAVAIAGWECDAATELLCAARKAVVRPLVRRFGLSGSVALQAEATGWATAWEVLSRPSASISANPAGLVWVAVRRAILEEVRAAEPLLGEPVILDWRGQPVWLDARHQASSSSSQSPNPVLRDLEHLGGSLSSIAEALVKQGWDHRLLSEALVLVADHASRRQGVPRVRWRWLSVQLRLPEWQARRLAELVMGIDGSSGLLELVVHHGRSVLEHPDAIAAMRTTVRRSWSGPRQHLEVLQARCSARPQRVPRLVHPRGGAVLPASA